MIPVLVLNLPRSATRRADIAARLDRLGIAHRFFDAIDGNLLTQDERDRLAPRNALVFDRALTAGEIGCAATHLAAIREIAAAGADFACSLEDDAVFSENLKTFLQYECLRSLPPFDVLRFVSDPARWKFPAWKIAASHDRGLYAMARAGWGLQGQVFSLQGARKIAAHIDCVRAPIDFALFHDCHVPDLRILELRPGVIEHDTKLINRELMALSTIQGRLELDRSKRGFSQRWRHHYWRWRRKLMAIRAFWINWRFEGLRHVVPWWPPGGYFR